MDAMMHESGTEHLVRTRVCDMDDAQYRTVAYAFGPITSVGGDWIGLIAFPTVPSGGIVGYVQDAVYGDLRSVVPYPPIHLHHIHTTRVGDLSAHRFETHGDYYNIQNNGYAIELPEGTCHHNTHAIPPRVGNGYATHYEPIDHLFTNAMINVDTAVERNMTWYLRIGFKIRKDATKCQHVDKLLLMPFGEVRPPSEQLQRFRVSDPDTAVYWWQGRFASAGKVAAVYRHSHRARDGGVLMYRGFVDPSMLKTPISTENATLHAVETALAPHMPSIKSDLRVASQSAAGFDVYGKLLFDNNMHLNYADEMTVISIYKGTPGSKRFDYTGLMLHEILFFYYVPDERDDEPAQRGSRMTDSSFCCSRWKLGTGTRFVKDGSPDSCDAPIDTLRTHTLNCDNSRSHAPIRSEVSFG
jgi:hypothetical protein